ncbi:toprim domain-containing protein [Algoriphagus resistens]|uniref:toprim domain-containing protein n=1 Tax=Algoriphagus resistens TaxID=1750590 RepID=UPI000716AEC0|nr:toprim domain-containing protein [Algoriphagus resistens]
MDIEKARRIPLSDILERLGVAPSKSSQKEEWYLSPFRNEKTASLHVDIAKNIWYDFGEDKGGDNIKFVREYLASVGQDSTVSAALRWLGNRVGGATLIEPIPKRGKSEKDTKLVIKSVQPLHHIALVRYLKSRGIPLKVAQKYVKEVSVYHTERKKAYFSIGFQNEEQGYELRNPYFKGCVRPKYLSFIRGTMTQPDGIHIFEGFMDFLSVITQRKGESLSNDTIVLNSLSCMKQATEFIKNCGYSIGFSWLDNDTAGQKALKAIDAFIKKEGMIHKPKNDIYAPHKDVNAWHIHTLGLTL